MVSIRQAGSARPSLLRRAVLRVVPFVATLAVSLVGFAWFEQGVPPTEAQFRFAVGTAPAEIERPATLSTAPALRANPAYIELTRAIDARIDYPWREELAGWTVTVQPPKGDLLGGTYPYEQRIELFVAPGDTADEVAFTFAHELAHALDVTYLDMDDRGRWVSARGLPVETTWWTGSGSDFKVGSGDLAESFAVWQVGGLSQSQLGGAPTAEQVEVLESLFPGVDRTE